MTISTPSYRRAKSVVVDRNYNKGGVCGSLTFETRVVSGAFDDAANRWTIRTDRGDTVSARFFIMAGGCLSLPRMPDFAGRDLFKGKVYHTGQWPHEGVDFSGQRVGVIGTGSSGIQLIPQVAAQAKHCTVFQRTPNFSLPAFNVPLEAELQDWYKKHYSARREKARYSSAGIAGHATPDKGALEVSADERARTYEAGWKLGSTGFTRIYKDILLNERANETMAAFVREKIRRTVRDPEVAKLLEPTDHAIGTKRICLDTGYYETYNRDNVTLVDVRKHPIVAVTATGIRTENAAYELDAIVFATGYDAVTGAVLDIDIKTRDGGTLAEKWKAGPRTYLGLMTHGFPNLLLVTGPGSPSVLTNMITSIEHHIEWIAGCMVHLRERGLHRMEAQRDYEDNWVQHVNEVADTTLFPRANSWYTGANIPGKPRVFLPYIGGHGTYRMKCADVAFRGYEGFVLSD